jgi:hypothetical protein
MKSSVLRISVISRLIMTVASSFTILIMEAQTVSETMYYAILTWLIAQIDSLHSLSFAVKA